jgi:hypothetical protein
MLLLKAHAPLKGLSFNAKQQKESRMTLQLTAASKTHE